MAALTYYLGQVIKIHYKFRTLTQVASVYFCNSVWSVAMQKLCNDKMLKHRTGFVEVVRSSINLDTPGRMDEAIDILEEWVKKQPHLVKNNFSRDYLESTLVTAKGLVERAKQRIDKLCTFKTLMPEYFAVSPDTRAEFERLAAIIPTVFLPMTTEEHYRINLISLITDDYDTKDVFVFYKYIIMLAEYVRKNDYMVGVEIVVDFRDRNILNFIAHVNPVMLRQIATIQLEGYGIRIRGITIITESKMVGALVALLKQVVSAKIISRIRVLPDLEALREFVPKEIMPVEYGGQEKPLKELSDNWIETLTATDNMDYFKEMAKAATNETYRRTDKFNQDYVGMPGSFRKLTVD